MTSQISQNNCQNSQKNYQNSHKRQIYAISLYHIALIIILYMIKKFTIILY